MMDTDTYTYEYIDNEELLTVLNILMVKNKKVYAVLAKRRTYLGKATTETV